MGPIRPLNVDSFPSAFSSTLGKERKRRVWPVGAVSKTIAEYSMDLTCLHTDTYRKGLKGQTTLYDDDNEGAGMVTYFIISANDIASSTPGMANARSCIMEPIMPFWSAASCR